MEVVCSSCGTEYDFDEARVPEGGVTVKCTTCGHVFKVSKNDDGAAIQETSAPASKAGNWQIKKENGDQLSFKALSTLQKWIVERKVAADDEISRTGDKWTRLADVPEFQVFFQALEPAPQQAIDDLEDAPLEQEDTEEAPETEIQEKENGDTEADPTTDENKPKTIKKAKAAGKKKTRGVAKRGTVKKKKRAATKKKSSSKKNITLEAFMQESDGDSKEDSQELSKEEAKAPIKKYLNPASLLNTSFLINATKT